MFFHITCQSCWSSAISSGLVVSSRAPRRGRENTVVELELLLIYLKYWPDLPYWNISSRGRGKGMPEPAPSGKQRKQRCQMRPKSGKHPIETRRGGEGGRGQAGRWHCREEVQLVGGQGDNHQPDQVSCWSSMSGCFTASLRCGLFVCSGLWMFAGRFCTFLLVRWQWSVFVKGEGKKQEESDASVMLLWMELSK